MNAPERLAAWKAAQAAIASDIDGYQAHIDDLSAHDPAEWVTESIAAAKRAIGPLSVALPMIEEQAKQAAFEVARLEKFATLRAENPSTPAARLAHRARQWVANNPDSFERLLED